MSNTTTKTARIGLILSREEKQLIWAAAGKRMLTLSEFIRQAAVEKARQE